MIEVFLFFIILGLIHFGWIIRNCLQYRRGDQLDL